MKSEDKQVSKPASAPVFPALLLAAGVIFSVWRGVVEVHNGLSLFAIINLIAPAVVAGGICHIIMTTVLRRRTRRLAEESKQKEESWKRATTNMQAQLLELRKEGERAEENQAKARAEVEREKSSAESVRSELNQLKQAQKNLSLKRQELESSKTVLELHVQERQLEIQKIQRQYELILNSAGEGICGLDLNGKATFVNPAVARITGWAVQELIGKTEEQIFGNAPERKETEKLSDEPFGERVFYRKDGTCLPVEYIRTPIDENGRLMGTVLVFKDITERKRVEAAIEQKAAELSRSNAELEQFAFVASHDLQEPLRKILAFGDRLKTRLEGALAPESKEYLDRMQNAAARMRTLIDDLLTFSRVIRRSEPFANVDLEGVMKGVMGDLEVRIERTGAQVEVGKLPTLEADPVQMHQLLLNLLGNALKFQTSGAKPVVKIGSRNYTTISGGEYCEISVQDNGIGFDEKYMDKIFAVFQRLHGRNEYEGTGVGLAVCRRITDRHHGTITAKSKPGEGATFLVTLPLRQTEQPRSTPV